MVPRPRWLSARAICPPPAAPTRPPLVPPEVLRWVNYRVKVAHETYPVCENAESVVSLIQLFVQQSAKGLEKIKTRGEACWVRVGVVGVELTPQAKSTGRIDTGVCRHVVGRERSSADAIQVGICDVLYKPTGHQTPFFSGSMERVTWSRDGRITCMTFPRRRHVSVKGSKDKSGPGCAAGRTFFFTGTQVPLQHAIRSYFIVVGLCSQRGKTRPSQTRRSTSSARLFPSVAPWAVQFC